MQVVHHGDLNQAPLISSHRLSPPDSGPFCLDRPLQYTISASIKERDNMLWTICVILLVLWAVGMVTSYTMGGLLHILLILAVIVLVFRLIQGRRSVI
jgi:hypothetical protein